MTAASPTRRMTWARRAGLTAAACAVLTGAGCRLFDRGRGSDSGLAAGERADPLLGARIPATDLPVPGRGEGYGKGRADPLLGSPTGRGERSSRADREPFRLGPGDTTAGLSGRLTPDGVGLSIGDHRPEAGPVMLRPTDGGPAYAEVTAGLKRFGATWAEPTRDGDGYVFRADVPIEGGTDGAVRRYEGTGSSAAAAAKQVLDQIKGDRGLE